MKNFTFKINFAIFMRYVLDRKHRLKINSKISEVHQKLFKNDTKGAKSN